MANLHAYDVNWSSRPITFERMKLRRRAVAPPQIRFEIEVAATFVQPPGTGPLFPYLRTVQEADGATELNSQGLGIICVTLHSYRYAWAVRAGICG